MEELLNLQLMAEEATSRFSEYQGADFVLPDPFKNEVKEINKNKITYNTYSAIIETRGVQRGVLNIFMPNQWFYIASYFTAFYNELQKYKVLALRVATKERLKELNGGQLSFYEQTYLDSLEISPKSKKYLKQFITDYQWWGGAKTIDRGDFYVSPILTYANLVNASQSFVADLCAFLSDKPSLCSLIIQVVEKPKGVHHSEFPSFSASLQQIFYGAPGTGKSHGIDVETKGQKVIRTTFHPDSDYSTFVGAYKPVMREVPTMTVIGTKSVAVDDSKGEPVVEKRIEYDFIPQAFTEAYVESWKNLKKPVFLVIEEINRGNCAQIFGDIFQLLDRDDKGYSSYLISPDESLHRYLEETFAKDGFDEDAALDKTDILEILEGKKMCLPPNLYIWATMNTSDQSLFPIDSAFKRRWDWKYTPISDAGEGYRIDVNGNSYDWWSFLEKVNEIVEEITSSEDKQLGYFFCKAENKKISAEKFVGKVIFYLWNDVFKDYGFDRDEFKYEEDGKKKTLTFRKFFKADGKINEVMAEKFLLNLGLKAIEKTEQAISQEEELALEEEDGQKEGKHDFIKAVTLNGERISIDDKTHFDVYLETVRRIGIAEAAPLIESCKYKRKKCPLASTVKYDAIENAPNYSYVEEGGFYFVKGAADKTLINVLNMLKQELSLDLEIEIYR